MSRTVCRRDFLAALLWFGTIPRLAEAADSGIELFASACMDREARYGLAFLNQYGDILATFPLPGRGHGMASGKSSAWIAAFARRPGNFALAVDRSGFRAPVLFRTPSHTHFYGHGAFSRNGRFLFATENAFSDGRGLIGIYDAAGRFERFGEIPSHGIGPHEIVLMPDGHTLCVANGGILTHPDTGRAKLNLHAMRSSVAFIDGRHGDLIAKLDVPDSMQRLSLRHMAVDHSGMVWLGGQYQGPREDDVPLIATASPDGGLGFPEFAPQATAGLSGYVGSVSSSSDGRRIAFTSPKGDALLIVGDRGNVVKQQNVEAVCGVAPCGREFACSSLHGTWRNRKHDVRWDNHLANCGTGLQLPGQKAA